MATFLQQLPIIITALVLLGKIGPIFSTQIINDEQQEIKPNFSTLSSIFRHRDDTNIIHQLQRTMKKRFIPMVNLPSSPPNLFHPDKFQFYTLDKSGQVVTKQMTRQEIQSLIAAGGGHLPTMAEQPQKAGEVPSSGTKVADVVQNVQNVLNSELKKPVSTIIAPPPTIPGHANSEWSNILPSILAAGEIDNNYTENTKPTYTNIHEKEVEKITMSSQNDDITERPMIQVPVITVEEKLPIQNNSSLSSQIAHNGIQNTTHHEHNKPIFEMLNTISAETLNNNKNNSKASEVCEKNHVKVKIDTDHDSSTSNNNDTMKNGMILMNQTDDMKPVKPVVLNNLLINENASLASPPPPSSTENFESTTLNSINFNSSSMQDVSAIIKTNNDSTASIEQLQKEIIQEDFNSTKSPLLQTEENLTTIKSIVTTMMTPVIITNTTSFNSSENGTISPPLLNELESSLSNMISQISQSISEQPLVIKTNSSLSSAIENAQKEHSPSNDEKLSHTPLVTSVNQTTFDSIIDNSNIKTTTENNETPIVRIDIMEATPQFTDTNSLKVNISQNLNDESPVVRIQLATTNTTSVVNHLIESFTSDNNYSTSLPKIETFTLPSTSNIYANNITSGLIAGFSNNNNNNNDNLNEKQDDTQDDIDKVSEDNKNIDSIEQIPLNDENYNISLDMLMQKINFDQLPIIGNQKIINPSNATLFKMKDNKTSITDITANPDYLSKVQVESVMKSEENFTDKINISTDIPTSQILIPSKIQLDDLPIVEKTNKRVDVKKNNVTVHKSNKTANISDINNHHDNNQKEIPIKEPIPMSNASIINPYENDPYKKLGEIEKPVKLVQNNISQMFNYANKTFKIKDQKKDSSMEKIPLVSSIIDLEKKYTYNNSDYMINNDSSIVTGIKTTTRKPVTTTITSSSSSTSTMKDDDNKNNNNSSNSELQKWTLIPQKLSPNTASKIAKPSINNKPDVMQNIPVKNQQQVALLNHSRTVDGLDSSVKNLEPDVSYFSNLCNDLAFSLWNATNQGLSVSRSLVISPFGMTSMLAMVFLGARGTTSDQMNNILKLDDVASFNPHLIFQNVTDSVGLARKQGVANAAFVRELFADKIKVRKLLPFYKEQAQQFYDGVVAEVNFATISDLVRRRTNLMIRKQTGGRIKDFVRANIVPLRSPLAALSANVYQTDCNSSDASSDGRDGELYFAVSPAVRQRKLIPVPSTVWKSGILAGYEPSLDATAIALGGPDKLVSTIFIIPGQQGFTAPGDSLELLEERLIRRAIYDGLWNKLLKVIIPRPGFELQVPKFSHRSIINATAALKRMGLQQLFDNHADLKGINGIGSDLHLTDALQMNLFSTCGDENILSGRHHVEIYPTNSQRDIRTVAHQLNKIPLNKEKHTEQLLTAKFTTTKINEDSDKPRLKLDRPFLYFVRHNPTGLILHMGRFNPRLLP